MFNILIGLFGLISTLLGEYVIDTIILKLGIKENARYFTLHTIC